MKKTLLSLLVLASSACSFSADATVMYGYQTFEPKESPKRGPAYFNTENPKEFTFIADCSNMGVVYGGYYLDYHWYVQAIVKGTESQVEGLYELNMTTGERTFINKGGSKLIDMTVDYSTGTIYGIRSGSRYLATFNHATGETTNIAAFSGTEAEPRLIAIAADLDGTLYGVSTDDKLFTINPKTAALTEVGPLGVNASFDQSMAFDYNTGTLYWANNGDNCLYTIDTRTGAAKFIGPIGENSISSMASLFIPYIHVAKGAPDRVTDRKASSTDNAVTLSWTNPSIDAQGVALSELTGIKVVRDGKEVANLSGQEIKPGSAMSFTDNGLSTGSVYRYSLVPYNSKGDGGVDGIELEARTGKDLAAAPGAFTAEQGDSEVTLSWTAPTSGAEGGNFDPADITGYEIKRGERVIKTVDATQLSYTDKCAFGRYTYSVAAITPAGTGVASTLSEVVVKPADWIVMGNGECTVEKGKTYQFYDEGGPAGGYRNALEQVLVLRPAKEGDYVCVDFTEFCTEEYGDFLYVYDGDGTSAPLIGEFASSFLPDALKHIESSSTTGCLTFEFISDAIFPESGWKAEVTVKSRYANDLEASVMATRNIVVAGKETTYTVNVSNKGLNTASGWTLSLLDGDKEMARVNGQELSTGESVWIPMSYTPESEGKMSVTARVDFEADNYVDNNRTPAVGQNVVAESSVFHSLEADESVSSDVSIIPMSFLAKESLSEVLVTAERLEAVKGMYLNGISYPIYEVTKTYNDIPVRMWAGQTSLESLKDEFVPAKDMTAVYDGTVSLNPMTKVLDFYFAEPVDYKEGNIAVMVHKSASPTNGDGVSFVGDYGYGHTHDNVSRFDSPWEDSDTDLLDPNEIFGYSASNILPDMVMLFSKDRNGVNDAAVDLSGATIQAVEGGIRSDKAAEVYTTGGMHVADIPAGGRASLAKGIYLVRSGKTAVKIAVR